jgi:hypothetical protein
VLAGYAGWLQSHGLPGYPRFSDMYSMMSGVGKLTSLRMYNVSYIVVPSQHRDLFAPRFLNAVALKQTSNGRYTVFRVLDDAELLAALSPCDVAAASEEGCHKAGCLWLPFFDTPAVTLPSCLRSSRPAVDCTASSEAACTERLCSWHSSFAGPWCHRGPHYFDGSFVPMTTLTPAKDCGWHGMDEQLCIDRCGAMPSLTAPVASSPPPRCTASLLPCFLRVSRLHVLLLPACCFTGGVHGSRLAAHRGARTRDRLQRRLRTRCSSSLFNVTSNALCTSTAHDHTSPQRRRSGHNTSDKRRQETTRGDTRRHRMTGAGQGTVEQQQQRTV